MTGEKRWSVGKLNAISRSWSFIPKENVRMDFCFLYKAWLVNHFKFYWHVLNVFCGSEVSLLWCTWDVFTLCVIYLLCVLFAWVMRRRIYVNRIIYRGGFSFVFQLKVLVCFSAAAELGSGMGSFLNLFRVKLIYGFNYLCSEAIMMDSLKCYKQLYRIRPLENKRRTRKIFSSEIHHHYGLTS